MGRRGRAMGNETFYGDGLTNTGTTLTFTDTIALM